MSTHVAIHACTHITYINTENKNLICVITREQREAKKPPLPQCWEVNPAPHIPAPEFPALILACLPAASLSSGLQCWEVVLLQWLLLCYFQIYVYTHIPALVFPRWQGDQLLWTVTFIFCTHSAVGRREWNGQWRTCFCLVLLLLSGWASRPFIKFSGMLITLV